MGGEGQSDVTKSIMRPVDILRNNHGKLVHTSPVRSISSVADHFCGNNGNMMPGIKNKLSGIVFRKTYIMNGVEHS